MQPARIDLRVVRGSSFSQTLQMLQPVFEYRPIESITAAAPISITTEQPHGLTSGWPVWIEGVRQGPARLNRSPSETPHVAQVTGDDTFEINAISAYGTAPADGMVIYRPPVDLTGSSARLQARTDTGVLVLDLSTTTGGITLNGGTLTVLLTPEQTQALSFSSASYWLEITDALGTETPWAVGTLTVDAGGVYD